ncbi:hypothetical protein [Prochlorococcus sp. MIT 1313]
MKLFSFTAASAAVFSASLINSVSAGQKINPIDPNLPDCLTGLRNGFLVDQQTGKPIMSARCQDYVDGQYWTVGQYVRSR